MNPKSSSQSATLPTTTLSPELYSSIPIAPTLVRTFNLDTYGNCLFLRKDVELRTKCRKMQFCHFFIELLWQEVDLVFVCLKQLGHTVTRKKDEGDVAPASTKSDT